MVCKECGAYNADDLVTCRVCGANLKEAQPGRPRRNFVEAPSFQGKAYGSETSDALKEAQRAAKERQEKLKAEAEAKAAAEAAKEAEQKKAAEQAASAPTRFCTACGKPLYADAPFCAFCGTRNALIGDTSAAPAVPVAPVAAAASVAAAGSGKDTFEDGLDDEDLYDDVDLLEEEDEKPIKNTIFHKKPKAEKQQKSVKQDPVDEDLDDEEFDDDEDFDDEYYDEEFDDDEEETPRKGKGSKVLFIVLIFVLIALIGFFGWYFMKKKGLTFSSLFGGSKQPQQQQQVQATQEPIIENEPITVNNMAATIKEDVIDGTEIFEINVKAPTGSTVRIISNASLERDSVTIDRDDSITLHVPRVVFLPGDYCETASVTVTPQLEVTLPDGSSHMLAVPAVNIVVSQVELTLTSPTTNPVEAPAGNRPITISGIVSDHTVQVTVNGASVQVFDGGEFTYDYYPKNVEGETIEVVAKKIDWMSAKQVIEVTPFVIKDLNLSITNGSTILRATDGLVTITGTCPDGSIITGTCADPEITCGTATVQNGQFSMVVNVPKEGHFEVELTGNAEGYNQGSTTCIVEAAPTLKYSKYMDKALNLNKKYDEVASKEGVSGVVFTGKVKEIIQTEPYVVFTMEKSGKVVYVANRSEKKTITTKDMNETRKAAGTYCGNYPETDCPFIWAWFITNG